MAVVPHVRTCRRGHRHELGASDLHVHDEANDIEYPPADALLVVGSQSLRYSPGGDYGFLGPRALRSGSCRPIRIRIFCSWASVPRN